MLILVRERSYWLIWIIVVRKRPLYHIRISGIVSWGFVWRHLTVSQSGRISEFENSVYAVGVMLPLDDVRKEDSSCCCPCGPLSSSQGIAEAPAVSVTPHGPNFTSISLDPFTTAKARAHSSSPVLTMAWKFTKTTTLTRTHSDSPECFTSPPGPKSFMLRALSWLFWPLLDSSSSYVPGWSPDQYPTSYQRL